MILFVASTPFHILSILNLSFTLFKNDKKTLIILDHSPSNYVFMKEIEKLDIFSQILFLKTKHYTGGNEKNALKRNFNTIVSLLKKRKITRLLKLAKGVYSKILISSPDIPSQIIYFHMKKTNKNIQLFMFEDGSFAYSYFEHKFSFFKRILLKIFFGKNIMREHVGGYIYKPELYTGKTKKVLIQIPNNTDDNFLSIINKVFFVESNQQLEDYNYFFFDQAFQFDSIILQGKQLLNLIKVKVNKDIIVKPHPRALQNIYLNNFPTFDSIAPFEVYLLKENLENKCFISINSTVCLNPKILFNKEPYVILLYKLINFDGIPNFNKNIELIVNKTRNNYVNNEKFFIPENLKELDYALEIIFRKG